MGFHFQQKSHINPFVIDQIQTVNFDFQDEQLKKELVLPFTDELSHHGGTAGFLRDEIPSVLADYHFEDLGNDAYLFSIHNELE